MIPIEQCITVSDFADLTPRIRESLQPEVTWFTLSQHRKPRNGVPHDHSYKSRSLTAALSRQSVRDWKPFSAFPTGPPNPMTSGAFGFETLVTPNGSGENESRFWCIYLRQASS